MFYFFSFFIRFLLNYFLTISRFIGNFLKNSLPIFAIISKIELSFTVSLIPFEISTKCKTKLNSINKMVTLPIITL